MKAPIVALFDSDGTLFDYDGQLWADLAKIRSPEEKEVIFDHNNRPKYLQRRIDLITSSESWWENLPKFQLGWDILEVVRSLGFRVMILTQAPRKNPAAWSGKKKCFDKHFGEDFDITLTRDKGLVYGKILVDDFPDYAKIWLAHRPRGLVIMPASEENKNFKHPQVIRYDGTNLEEVRKALQGIKDNFVPE